MFDLLTVLLIAFLFAAVYDYALYRAFKDSPKTSHKD